MELRAGLEPACTRFAGAAVSVPVTATRLDPGAGLEPASRRSERRILPLDDPGMCRACPGRGAARSALVRSGAPLTRDLQKGGLWSWRSRISGAPRRRAAPHPGHERLNP